MAKTRTGVVVSTKMDKTVVVRIDRMVNHAKYGKRYRVSNKFSAHDANNEAKLGDVVTIIETKPISKTKSWKLAAIVTKAELASQLSDAVVQG